MFVDNLIQNNFYGSNFFISGIPVEKYDWCAITGSFYYISHLQNHFKDELKAIEKNILTKFIDDSMLIRTT